MTILKSLVIYSLSKYVDVCIKPSCSYLITNLQGVPEILVPCQKIYDYHDWSIWIVKSKLNSDTKHYYGDYIFITVYATK